MDLTMLLYTRALLGKSWLCTAHVYVVYYIGEPVVYACLQVQVYCTYSQTSLIRNSGDCMCSKFILTVFHVNSTTCYAWTCTWTWLAFHVKRYFMLSSFMLTRFDCMYRIMVSVLCEQHTGKPLYSPPL